jgi:aconitate hydratase
MLVETGATTAVFPSDGRVLEWLSDEGRGDQFVALAADPGAHYDVTERLDLSALEPMVALPHSPGNVVPVRDVAGTKTAQVCIGASVNGSAEDLSFAAAVLRGEAVHPGVQLTVTPGSREVLDAIARNGSHGDFVAAGARVLEPICGPCIGVGLAPPAGEPSVRTFNRNFPGRSGTMDDEVYLCSPATAAATAIRGEITDPRTLGRPPAVPSAPPDPAAVDRHILPPPPQEDGRRVEVLRGPTIAPPPTNGPLPASLRGRVVIVLGDDVSTGDMAPDGAVGMSLWSNVPDCARHMFRRLDPDFYDRAQAWGGGFIVAGHNYGQGSSREQAALAPVHLGIRAVVAGSFARIHRSNLVAHGVVPLTFTDDDDFGRIGLGATLRLEGLRAAIEKGLPATTLSVDGQQDIVVGLQLTAREREMVLEGGLLGRIRRAATPGVRPEASG